MKESDFKTAQELIKIRAEAKRAVEALRAGGRLEISVRNREGGLITYINFLEALEMIKGLLVGAEDKINEHLRSLGVETGK